MRTGTEKVTKRRWYDTYGGFSNPHCFRRADTRGKWAYFINWN